MRLDASVDRFARAFQFQTDTHNLTQLQAHSLSHRRNETERELRVCVCALSHSLSLALSLCNMYDNKPVFRFHVISATNEKFKKQTQIKYIHACMLKTIRTRTSYSDSNKRVKTEYETNLFSFCFRGSDTVGKIDEKPIDLMSALRHRTTLLPLISPAVVR